MNIPLGAKFKGIVKMETPKFIRGEEGSNPVFYKLAELYINNPEELQKEFGSPKSAANFELSGITVLVEATD